MEHSLEIIGRIFGVSTLRYFVIAGIPFLLFYRLFTAYFAKSKIQNRQANKQDFVREMLHSLQTTAIFALIGFLVLYTPFRQYTLVYQHLSDYPGWWILVSLILSLILHDTYFYWMHRLLHHKRLFSYTHRLHHKSTNPSPWASYSFSFLEAVAEGAVLVVVVLLIPMHLLTVVLFIFVGFVINVYGHLGYEIAPRWFRHSFLFAFINTSVHHNLHHSKFRGNYGLYFRLWDRLMRTENSDYVSEYDQPLPNQTPRKRVSSDSRLSVKFIVRKRFSCAKPALIGRAFLKFIYLARLNRPAIGPVASLCFLDYF